MLLVSVLLYMTNVFVEKKNTVFFPNNWKGKYFMQGSVLANCLLFTSQLISLLAIHRGGFIRTRSV
jgi:hypothetical protein